MRAVSLVTAILFSIGSTVAAEIREFDLKTTEYLRNELTRVSRRSNRGATNPSRKRASHTAKAALQGKLFDIHYDYVVLDGPDGSGFLVYALGQGSKPGDTVVHGHFRVTVSADGQKAERVDALLHSVMIDQKNMPKIGSYQKWGLATSQIVGTLPVET